MGIVRTTFIIDAQGILRKVIPVKRVAGHDEAVAEALAELN
jgi:peroxiredoxin